MRTSESFWDTPMFEVWWSRGGCTRRGPRFRQLEDALRYVEDHACEAAYAVRWPDGSWRRFGWQHRPTPLTAPSR